MKNKIRRYPVLAGLLFAALPPVGRAAVKRTAWGHGPDGSTVDLYILTSPSIEVRVTNYGAHLVSIRAPDRNGTMADVVLGYDSLAEYLADKKTHFGAVVGRFANRIANGTFALDGKNYSIPVNNGRNALHGGTVGFDQHVWKGHEVRDGVEFSLISPDGEMGFPGTLQATVRYTLEGDVLRLDYTATSDQPTVVNLTNHAYFNLSGDDADNILGDEVTIFADRYTPVNTDLIPTGAEVPVASTPFDFRQPKTIASRIGQPNEQLQLAGGYDHNFVLNGSTAKLKMAAIVHNNSTGRVLTVKTTEPGIQFYSGNHLDGTFVGRHQKSYTKHSGLCLETQHFPDSPNQPSFPTTVLRPGKPMHSTTTLTFSVAK
jgi:aldose 1-epimerase